MRTDNKFLKLIFVFAVLGLLVSAWLLSIHIRLSTGQAGLTESCSILPGSHGQGCATVAVSNFSTVLGVPLASIAMAVYLSLLCLMLWVMRNPQSSYEAVHVGFFLSTISILVTVTMAYISHYVVKSFCTGCATLWLINLAIWPCFVKHMQLPFGNALAENLELFRSKKYQLKQARIFTTLGLCTVLVVAVGGLAAMAESMQAQDTMGGEEGHTIKDYQEAKMVFLPAEAFGGLQSKGGSTSEAPVLDIVEFSDLQCPACRMAARFFKPFLLKHADQVRFTYRHFPLNGACNPYVPNGMHVFGCAAAKAGICAAKQNKFFDYHDQVFDNQDELSESLLKDLAKNVGLDMTAFEACLSDKSTDADLQQQIEWGERIGLESTPTIVINGHKLVGAIPPSQLEALFTFVKHAH